MKIPIDMSQSDIERVKELQKLQSPLIRTAYVQGLNGVIESSTREELNKRFDCLDSWWHQSAVNQGMGFAASDTATDRTQRVFGGKRNLARRAKGLITNEEFKELRLLPIHLIGEAPKKGNRKFTFELDKIIFKPFRGEKIEIQLPKLRNRWRKTYEAICRMADQRMIPVTISLTATDICITYDDKKVAKYLKEFKAIHPAKKGRFAGIDMNPNYIGVAVFDGTRLVSSKMFSMISLTGKSGSSSKIGFETHEVGHAIGKYLKHLRVEHLFVEGLTLKPKNNKKGKNFNRLVNNQWKRKHLLGVLAKYYRLFEINAAYTSTIGNLLNPALPDPAAAATAVAQRGYEIIIKKSKKFYPELPAQRDLEDRWKETEIPVCSTWKELHDFITKTAKLKYRIPIPKESVFQNFASHTSHVLVLNDFRY